jgi:hypothetical protein
MLQAPLLFSSLQCEKGQEGKEEDVSSYWMTLRKREDNET